MNLTYRAKYPFNPPPTMCHTLIQCMQVKYSPVTFALKGIFCLGLRLISWRLEFLRAVKFQFIWVRAAQLCISLSIYLTLSTFLPSNICMYLSFSSISLSLSRYLSFTHFFSRSLSLPNNILMTHHHPCSTSSYLFFRHPWRWKLTPSLKSLQLLFFQTDIRHGGHSISQSDWYEDNSHYYYCWRCRCNASCASHVFHRETPSPSFFDRGYHTTEECGEQIEREPPPSPPPRQTAFLRTRHFPTPPHPSHTQPLPISGRPKGSKDGWLGRSGGGGGGV